MNSQTGWWRAAKLCLMFLTNTRPRRHQEERRGAAFKLKAAAARISRLIAAGQLMDQKHHQRVYKATGWMQRGQIPPGRLNAQPHPSTSLSPAAGAQTRLPGDAEGEHLPNPPIPRPVLQPHDAAPGLFSGDTAPTALPSFKSLPGELPTIGTALCRVASPPLLPTCATEHLPLRPTPYRLLEDSEFQA